MNGFGSERIDPDQVKYEAEQVKSAIDALADIADEDSLACLKRLNALLADNYTGSGLWEAIDAKLAEIAAS